VYLVGYSDENKKEFLENFGYNLPFIKCTTIEDMAIVINSCKLFIGMMSSPLTLAQGCHHNTLALLGSSMDTVHNMLNDYLPTYKYII
jgi:ADP-heptose:LPS heptosyltransferase